MWDKTPCYFFPSNEYASDTGVRSLLLCPGNIITQTVREKTQPALGMLYMRKTRDIRPITTLNHDK